MLENAEYWFIVIDESKELESFDISVDRSNVSMKLSLFLSVVIMATSSLSQVKFKGLSPWLLEHIICVLMPSVISSSNEKGAIRGGTKQI